MSGPSDKKKKVTSTARIGKMSLKEAILKNEMRENSKSNRKKNK